MTKRFIAGSNRSYVLLTIAIWAVLYLPNLWWRDLTGTDEPKYAQVAREVLLDGHWFALHLNGAPYYGEPPLYFWSEALLSLPHGDVTPFIAMLTACLFGLGTILLTYFLGKRLFDADTGFLGAAILATLPQFHN
ncbi:MAG: glycosyltransferase family 39 protein, partial [Planctomycetota bacterium]